MNIKNILIHPDSRLRKKTTPMATPIVDLADLIEDMFETMYKAPGIGLAAPQIGVMERLFVMDPAKEDTHDPYVMINPEIILASEEMNAHEEGCLSIPGIYETIARPEALKIRYLDQDFKEQEREFDGLYATCIQHELDHLNGILFIDYLSPLKNQMITKKMQKFKRDQLIDKTQM